MNQPTDTYQYVDDANARPKFVISARPHLMMKLKRIMPHGRSDRHGLLHISATKEIARDLEMFNFRHPLAPADDESLAQLTKLADAHRAGEETIARILEGDVSDYGNQTPAVTPRDYQLVPRAMVRAQGFLLLGDDVGLGKTLASSLLFTDSSALRGLVVAPTHLVRQWEEELAKYYPWLRTHAIRQGRPYEVGQRRLLAEMDDADVLLCNYHKLGGWGNHLRGKVKTVVFDEGHELRTGSGTSKYAAAAMIAGAAQYRIVCTATPVYNYGREIHNVVSILDPNILGTADEFTREWGGDKIPNPRALGGYLRESGIMLRRSRKDVGRELPAVSSMVQPVETDHTKLEAMMAQGIVAMAAKVLDDTDEDRWSLSGQLEIKARHATGVAKAPYVAAFARLLLQREEKIVLVGHHHDVYEIWRQHLADFNPVEYTGAQTDTQKREAVRRFVDGDSRVMILAVRSGAGLNGLQLASSTMVFGELDWSPAQHHQVIGRLNRDGQKDPVAVFYMLSDGGSDPAMAELLDLKRRIAEPINDPDDEIVAPSQEGALRRVQALAKDLLRQHGIDLNAPKMPPPVPGSGELFNQAVLAATANAARKPKVAAPPKALPPDEAMEAAIAAVANRVDQRAAMESRRASNVSVRVAASRDSLRGRLAGDRS